jgi:hypothetical protein
MHARLVDHPPGLNLTVDRPEPSNGVYVLDDRSISAANQDVRLQLQSRLEAVRELLAGSPAGEIAASHVGVVNVRPQHRSARTSGRFLTFDIRGW